MNRYGEPDFKYIWNKIKQNGVAGKSAYEYAVEAGYTGTEAEFAEKLASAFPTKTSDLINDSGYITSTAIAGKANDEDVVHKSGTETVTGKKVFTASAEISRSDSGTILKLTSGASNTNFILERTGGSQCVLESGTAVGLFGTKTNHPLQVRTNYTNRMTFGTDGSVKLVTKPSSSDSSMQVATTNWAMTGDEITNICQ